MDLEHALTHGELQTPCASIGKTMKKALRKMSTLYDLPACDAARVDHAPLPLHRLIETSKLRGQAPAAVLLDVRRSGVTASFRPKSSIIMVVHNAGPALKLSLPRLFNQTFGCAELLLLLDQCSDDSIEIIASNLDVVHIEPTPSRPRARAIDAHLGGCGREPTDERVQSP